MKSNAIFDIFTKSVLQSLLDKVKCDYKKSWKKDKLVELCCEVDLNTILNKLKTEQLKTILDEMKLSKTGKKSVLVDTIIQNIESVEPSNKEKNSSTKKGKSKSAKKQPTSFTNELTGETFDSFEDYVNSIDMTYFYEGLEGEGNEHFTLISEEIVDAYADYKRGYETKECIFEDSEGNLWGVRYSRDNWGDSFDESGFCRASKTEKIIKVVEYHF